MKLPEKPAKEEVWDFHCLQLEDYRGISTLQVIRNLCTKYHLNELDSIADAQSIIED